VVSAQRRRRTVPHHLGTTVVLPLHCHNSTVILPPSTLPTPAEPEREKRNRTEQRGKKKKQRLRALHRGGEEKTVAPPPGIIIISPPSRCPDHLPLPPDHKRGRTEQTRGRGRDSRRQQEEGKKNCNSSIAAWNNARLPPQAAVSSATRALPFHVTLFSASRLLGWSLACRACTVHVSAAREIINRLLCMSTVTG